MTDVGFSKYDVHCNARRRRRIRAVSNSTSVMSKCKNYISGMVVKTGVASITEGKSIETFIESLSNFYCRHSDLVQILLVLESFYNNVYRNPRSQLMRLWYLSHRRPAKAQARLRGCFAVLTHELWK